MTGHSSVAHIHSRRRRRASLQHEVKVTPRGCSSSGDSSENNNNNNNKPDDKSKMYVPRSEFNSTLSLENESKVKRKAPLRRRDSKQQLRAKHGSRASLDDFSFMDMDPIDDKGWRVKEVRDVGGSHNASRRIRRGEEKDLSLKEDEIVVASTASIRRFSVSEFDFG